MLNKIHNMISGRNSELRKSMLLSAVYKPVGMLISFFYTPILLSYLGEESYGIWSTMLSIINWINYFDIGIGQGLRNKLTKDLTNGDSDSAHKAISTAYVVLSVISVALMLIGTIIITQLDCFRVFNTSVNVKPALQISFIFICINFVLALSKMQLYATHQAEKVGLMTILVQLVNLLGIIGLKFFIKESILAVALVVGLSGLIVNVFFTGIVWGKFRMLIPHPRDFSRYMLKDICSIGIKFLFIQLAALILYSTDNIIITQLFGPEYVTPYHTSYTIFGLVNGLFGAFITPLWSKYTSAVELNDYVWIKNTVIKLDKMLPFVAAVLFVGCILFEPVSQIWLQRKLNYEPGLIPMMAVYFFLMVVGAIYSTVLNGMGKVNMQLILSVISAALNIPLSIYLGRDLGLRTTGVLIATIVCMLFTNIPIIISFHIDLKKCIAGSKKNS